VAHSCETSVVLAGCLKLHTWIQAIRNLAAISTYAYVGRRTRGVPPACDSDALSLPRQDGTDCCNDGGAIGGGVKVVAW
jgi:hypothetical protein